jgi:hypothetical protein
MRIGGYIQFDKMINNNTYYQLIEQHKSQLREYAISNDCVDSSYHVAMKLIGEMSQKAYRDKSYLQIAMSWLSGGKTIELKNALHYTSYQEINLTHFNAMCMMDAVSSIKKRKHNEVRF